MFAAGMPGVGLSEHSAAVGVSNSAKLIHAAGAAAGPHSAHQLGRGGSSAASSWLPHTGNAVMASVTSGNFPSGEAGMLFKQATAILCATLTVGLTSCNPDAPFVVPCHSPFHAAAPQPAPAPSSVTCWTLAALLVPMAVPRAPPVLGRPAQDRPVLAQQPRRAAIWSWMRMARSTTSTPSKQQKARPVGTWQAGATPRSEWQGMQAGSWRAGAVL